MNILLTSAGRRTYLVKYFKNALRGKGLVYASNSIPTYTLTQADEFIITPNIYDEEYISFLLKYCCRQHISTVISLFDIDLPILAQNKQEFLDNGINLLVSDYEVTKICNDKWATYKYLSELRLSQPKSYINIDAAKQALYSKEVEFPLILKPRWGMGSIGVYTIDTEQELNVLYRKLHSEIFETYLRYESQIDTEQCIIIQEKITGDEYGLEIINDLKGNYVTTFAKKKLAMRSGETDIAEIVDNIEFVKTANIIANNLKHIGILDCDCFKTDSGDLIILEMNCRFGGQYPFSHIAGADVPKQIINWLEGKDTDLSLLNPRIGVKCCKEVVPVEML